MQPFGVADWVVYTVLWCGGVRLLTPWRLQLTRLLTPRRLQFPQLPKTLMLPPVCPLRPSRYLQLKSSSSVGAALELWFAISQPLSRQKLPMCCWSSSLPCIGGDRHLPRLVALIVLGSAGTPQPEGSAVLLRSTGSCYNSEASQFVALEFVTGVRDFSGGIRPYLGRQRYLYGLRERSISCV